MQDVHIHIKFQDSKGDREKFTLLALGPQNDTATMFISSGANSRSKENDQRKLLHRN